MANDDGLKYAYYPLEYIFCFAIERRSSSPCGISHQPDDKTPQLTPPAASEANRRIEPPELELEPDSRSCQPRAARASMRFWRQLIHTTIDADYNPSFLDYENTLARLYIFVTGTRVSASRRRATSRTAETVSAPDHPSVPV